MRPFKRNERTVTRYWFQDRDGSYFRTCPLIMQEMDWARLTFRFGLAEKLRAEWHQCWDSGVIRKAELEPGDAVTEAAPFREAYPDHPGLWMLDGADSRDRLR
jgi:hypothetical protein